MKAKYVSLEDEKEFIRLDTEIKDRGNLLEKLKNVFRKQFDRGYKFKLLTPKPSVGRVQIDWQEEFHTIADAHLTVKEKGKLLRRIEKKYPPTPVATSFTLPPKKEAK